MYGDTPDILEFKANSLIPYCYDQRTSGDYHQGQLIPLRYDLKNSWCYPTISASWALTWPLECLSVFKLKSAIHTIIRL